jgi:hypothetical protein
MGNRVFRILKFAVIGVAAVALVSFVVMSLWNLLMPAIFGLHVITFWQALGLLILSKLLLGGFRPSGRGGPGWNRGRWEQMSPEDRMKFKRGMRGGCGFGRKENTPSEAPVQA